MHIERDEEGKIDRLLWRLNRFCSAADIETSGLQPHVNAFVAAGFVFGDPLETQEAFIGWYVATGSNVRSEGFAAFEPRWNEADGAGRMKIVLEYIYHGKEKKQEA